MDPRTRRSSGAFTLAVSSEMVFVDLPMAERVSAAHRTERVVYDDTGRLVEIEQRVYPAARYRLPSCPLTEQ